MALSNVTVQQTYTANGSSDTFAIPFTYILGSASEQIKVMEVDEDGVETLYTEGVDFDFDPAEDVLTAVYSANVVFDTAPAAGTFIRIRRELPLTQVVSYLNNGAFLAKDHERGLDRIVMEIQQLNLLVSRALVVPNFPTAFNVDIEGPLEPGYILRINEAGDGFEFVSIVEASAGSPGGLPAGGGTGDLLEKQSATDGDAEFAQFIQEGFSSRYGEAVSLASVREQLDYIFDITYTAPLITLSGTSNSVREKGDTLASITLTAAITKRSDPIQEVRFYRQPSTLLDTQTSGGGIPSGGNSTYNYATPFADTTQFRAEVDDNGDTGGPTTVTSNTLTYTFVYPYYVGAGAAGLSAANVALLTKLVQVSTATVNRTITAGSGEVFFFAYPASYGALTSILDVNNFETLPDWTLRTENITGLDGNPVSYRIYEFDNPVTAGDYYYSFRR